MQARARRKISIVHFQWYLVVSDSQTFIFSIDLHTRQWLFYPKNISAPQAEHGDTNIVKIFAGSHNPWPVADPGGPNRPRPPLFSADFVILGLFLADFRARHRGHLDSRPPPPFSQLLDPPLLTLGLVRKRTEASILGGGGAIPHPQ